MVGGGGGTSIVGDFFAAFAFIATGCLAAFALPSSLFRSSYRFVAASLEFRDFPPAVLPVAVSLSGFAFLIACFAFAVPGFALVVAGFAVPALGFAGAGLAFPAGFAEAGLLAVLLIDLVGSFPSD